MTTRASLIASAALALAPGFASADIVISNFGSYMAEDAVPSFTAETGINAELVEHATNPDILAKIIASGGEGYDVLFVASTTAEILNNLGLLAPIDHAQVPNLANLYPEASQLPHDPGNTFSVPYTWGTTGFCYRSDLVSTPPDSWSDLLTPPAELAGKVTMLGEDRWLLGAAFLSRGHSVNDTDQAHLDEVTQDLIAAKSTMLAYDDYTMADRLVSGEAWLTHSWDNMCIAGIAQQPAITFAVPSEGSDFWVDEMVVLRASENKDEAFAFINYVLDAENHAWTAENILSKVPNRPAMESLPSELLATYPTLAMEPAEIVAQEQLRDVGEATRGYARAVAEIKAAN